VIKFQESEKEAHIFLEDYSELSKK